MPVAENNEKKFVNGNNIRDKIKQFGKIYDKDPHNTKNNLRIKYLKEIIPVYKKWKKENLDLKGPFAETSEEDTKKIINKRTKWFNMYKNFIEQKKYAITFDSRSNLQSSVLEEFMYYLFKDIGSECNEETYVGKARALKDFFIQAPSFNSMVTNPDIREECKDVDFMIGPDIKSRFQVYGSQNKQNENIKIPAVSIECKTYVDKNMLGEIFMTSAQQKAINPNTLCIIVAEFMKLSPNINFHKSKVDEIFVLRKQKNVDRKVRLNPKKYHYHENPIYSSVVLQLFLLVKNHLTDNWKSAIKKGLTEGKLI